MEYDIASILRGINEDPEDDVLRLVAADWYEEYGQEERGEFVRVQVELARMRAESTGERRRPGQHASRPCRHVYPEACGDCRALVRREQRLLQEHGPRWLRAEFYKETDGSLEKTPTFQRGFVGEIKLPLASFMRNAEEVLKNHPITEVVLTGKEPSEGPLYQRGQGHEWYVARPWGKWWEGEDFDDLPEEFVEYLVEAGGLERGNRSRWVIFPDRAAAVSAASYACVRYGLEKAGVVRKGGERSI